MKTISLLILLQVWDMSDLTGKGYLEKPGFYVALKLIALAQAGQEMNVSKLTVEAPQPNLVRDKRQRQTFNLY
jgi:epidermal growth factor receptor substrate 15